jgi:hypothetical protein
VWRPVKFLVQHAVHAARDRRFAHFLAIAVVVRTKSLKIMEASAGLLGYAKLGFHPGPEVLTACWEALPLRSWTSKCALALAMLVVRRRPKWHGSTTGPANLLHLLHASV